MPVTSTSNAGGLLTPTFSRGRRMPYAPGFERALQGIARGWKPKRKDLRRLSPGKAKGMLKEADRTRQAKHRGQIKAVRSMSGANG